MSRYIQDFTLYEKRDGGIKERMTRYADYSQNIEYVNSINKGIASSAYMIANRISSSNNHLSRDLSSEMRSNTIQLESSINKMGEGIMDTIVEENSKLVGAMDQGFETMGNQINELSNTIANLGFILDNRLLELIRTTELTNQKLDSLLLAARVPDFQKERIHYIEQGFKYLKNSLFDKKRLNDSIEFFEKALTHDKRDFLVNYQLGSIFLYEKDFIDVNRSIQYFELAADYANDEIDEESTKTVNPFNNTPFTSAQKITYFAYKNLAYAYYIEFRIEDAEKALLNALKYIPKEESDIKVKYFLAEILVLLDKTEEGIKYLEEVFQTNHWFIIEAFSNENFFNNIQSQKYIDKVISIYKKTALDDLSACEKVIIKGSENEKKINTLRENNFDKNILGYIPIINDIGINSLPIIYSDNFKKKTKKTEIAHEVNLKKNGDYDVLFDDAARLIVENQIGSASLLQRKLKLGYNRADRIIDQLEEAGFIGSHEGSKAREVLITDLDTLEQHLKDLLR